MQRPWGNKASAGIDARRSEKQLPAPGCAECGAGLRSTGLGRHPVYCGRSCSSRAYRRRREMHQQDAVADALIASRVETSDTGAAGDDRFLELAVAV
ncbi:hypothetical protein GCM10023235_78530 [Kitasatospora terrestris]|uniref:Recombinase zinc beta ribbon domain-containing protein n=1 Tax=Kitasatospora terrestris TaxID=258051 RepID=A0ABP9EUQ9_9ACTN